MSRFCKATWVHDAINVIRADYKRSSDTHLHKPSLPLLESAGIHIYLKDESTHPTGSLKHRLARSLFLYALCNGWIHNGTTIIEASSGSTAVSEAYFARLLQLPFVAVMPKTTSPEKIAQIEFYGGKAHLVDSAASVIQESEILAKQTGGHFMNQFLYAERATDWRSNNNIAESILSQMENELFPTPAAVIVGAGTGGTAATISRYCRFSAARTRVIVADPENSVFFSCWKRHHNIESTEGAEDKTATAEAGEGEGRVIRSSRVEGIGRLNCEPSFVPGCVDGMVKVPDAASFGAMRVLHHVIGKRPGGSSGTCFYATLLAARDMLAKGERGSLVTLVCDSGERYLHTYYNDSWLTDQRINIAPYEHQVAQFIATCKWSKIPSIHDHHITYTE
eukprot:ANDGO_07070.mRNA.1 Putative pyridoxal-phosphate dependent protein F13B12.4